MTKAHQAPSGRFTPVRPSLAPQPVHDLTCRPRWALSGDELSGSIGARQPVLDNDPYDDAMRGAQFISRPKHYKPENTVGSKTVQAFIGALIGKGVLITTSKFSKAAINAANQSGHLRLVLIDGAELRSRFNVDVRVARAVEIRRVDPDYFENAEPE
jgi:hypothetical protein